MAKAQQTSQLRPGQPFFTKENRIAALGGIRTHRTLQYGTHTYYCGMFIIIGKCRFELAYKEILYCLHQLMSEWDSHADLAHSSPWPCISREFVTSSSDCLFVGTGQVILYQEDAPVQAALFCK